MLTRRRWISVVVALVVLSAMHVSSHVGFVGDGSYFVVVVGASIFGLVALVRRPRGKRYPWVWIAVGVISSTVGDCLYEIVGLRDVLPDTSIADVFFIGGYVSLGIGLLGILGIRGSGRPLDVDGLIDVSSFAIVAVILVGRIVDVGAIFADHSVSTTVQLVWAAYPVLDAALLAVLIRSIFSRRLTGAAGLLITTGVACWLVSDFASLLIAESNTLSAWMELGWMLGAAAMAAAVLDRGTAASAAAGEVAPARVTGARVLISLCPLMVPGAIETWAYIDGGDPNPIPLLVATAMLIVLAAARSTRLVQARDLQEARLARSERYYQALAENSADAVVVVDPAGRIVNDAPILAEMIGKPGTVTAGTDAIELIEPINRDQILGGLERVRSTSGTVIESEIRFRHADGSDRWFGLRVVNRADDPAIGGLVINIHDITDRKRAEEELRRRAFNDSLTGLANRALFRDRVEHALQRAARTGEDIAVVYLDIDGFKTVNDSRGHESGDHVLREISARLLSAVRTADTVARLGGDEFAILLEQSTSPLDEATTIADRVLKSLVAPVRFDDQQIVLSASIGIAVGDAASTASSMMRDADIAMYRAKTTGKAKWTIYEPEMRAVVVERQELETDLARALADEQFKLVYQPILELESERIVGFEALLRWHHPTRGVVAPDAFIPITEDNGSIVPIGDWVLNEACRTGATWQKRHPDRALSMAVNLSTRQIATPDIVEHVRLALQRSGFAPSSLVLEMTETVLVHDSDTAALRLHELRALGVKLAIDDFGTGYSSLSYLRQFPFDILKIDRSFINSITDRNEIPAIIRGMLDLGRTLNLEIIAEGIESGVQRDSLRDQHCEFGQGFLFAKPLSTADAGALLDRLADTDLRLGVTPLR